MRRCTVRARRTKPELRRQQEHRRLLLRHSVALARTRYRSASVPLRHRRDNARRIPDRRNRRIPGAQRNSDVAGRYRLTHRHRFPSALGPDPGSFRTAHGVDARQDERRVRARVVGDSAPGSVRIPQLGAPGGGHQRQRDLPDDVRADPAANSRGSGGRHPGDRFLFEAVPGNVRAAAHGLRAPTRHRRQALRRSWGADDGGRGDRHRRPRQPAVRPHLVRRLARVVQLPGEAKRGHHHQLGVVLGFAPVLRFRSSRTQRRLRRTGEHPVSGDDPVVVRARDVSGLAPLRPRRLLSVDCSQCRDAVRIRVAAQGQFTAVHTVDPAFPRTVQDPVVLDRRLSDRRRSVGYRHLPVLLPTGHESRSEQVRGRRPGERVGPRHPARRVLLPVPASPVAVSACRWDRSDCETPTTTFRLTHGSTPDDCIMVRITDADR